MPAQVPAKHVRVLGAIGDSEANRGRGGDRGRGRGRGGRGRGRGRGGGADLPEGIESHNVVVIRGTHKGMVGVITDTTETHVQVQMQATNKTVPVRIKDDQGRFCIKCRDASRMRATPSTNTYFPNRTPGHQLGGAPPAHGATPMHGGAGGATPSRGGATPAHATPMHSGVGGATPLHESSTTPLHESVRVPSPLLDPLHLLALSPGVWSTGLEAGDAVPRLADHRQRRLGRRAWCIGPLRLKRLGCVEWFDAGGDAAAEGGR